MGENCCKKLKAKEESTTEEILFNKNEFIPSDPTQELIFPPELKVCGFYLTLGIAHCHGYGFFLYGRISLLPSGLLFCASL